jgi:uncharacterized DUF497 family protein
MAEGHDDDESPELAEAFEWDDDSVESGNTAHLARHGIWPHEVEELFANAAPIFRNKASGSGEYLMIGTTDGDRSLTIVMNYSSRRRCVRAFAGWESTDDEKLRRDRSAS